MSSFSVSLFRYACTQLPTSGRKADSRDSTRAQGHEDSSLGEKKESRDASDGFGNSADARESNKGRRVPKISSCARRGQRISNLDRALITRVHTRVRRAARNTEEESDHFTESASHVFPICRYLANDRDYFALPCRRRERVPLRETHT